MNNHAKIAIIGNRNIQFSLCNITKVSNILVSDHATQ